MQVDRILFPVTTLGPGKRLTVWTIGCSKRCRGCANAELQRADPSRDIPAPELVRSIKRTLGGKIPDGVTVTGGDPMEQPEELLRLLDGLSDLTDDILVYTGYTVRELQKRIDPELLEKLFSRIGVLIDGRYVEALNDGVSPLRGSVNQRIIFLKKSLEERYEEYLGSGRKIQNFHVGGRIVSVGIHNKQQ